MTRKRGIVSVRSCRSADSGEGIGWLPTQLAFSFSLIVEMNANASSEKTQTKSKSDP
jgi:hypothetical protein